MILYIILHIKLYYIILYYITVYYIILYYITIYYIIFYYSILYYITVYYIIISLYHIYIYIATPKYIEKLKTLACWKHNFRHLFGYTKGTKKKTNISMICGSWNHDLWILIDTWASQPQILDPSSKDIPKKCCAESINGNNPFNNSLRAWTSQNINIIIYICTYIIYIHTCTYIYIYIHI